MQTALAGKLALECLGLAVLQVDDVIAESLVDGKHQAHNDEQEWQRSHNGDVLQVGQGILISQQQGQANSRGGYAPCCGQPWLSVGRTVLRHGTHNGRSRVSGGDEEGCEQDSCDDAGDEAARQVVQQVEQLNLRGLAGDGVAILLHVDCGAAEDGEPHGGKASRDQHDADAEFADGTAAGNACQEHTDEWGPGDPPCPVEDGPGGQPLACFAVVGLSSTGNHLGERIQVVTDGARNLVQDGNGWAQDEYEDGKQCGHNHVGVGDILNALAHAGHCGKQEGQGQHEDDANDDLLGWVVDEARSLDTSLDLGCTDTQGTCGTEDGCKNGQDVNDFANPTIGSALADERHECLTQQLLAANTEGRVRNCETNDGINSPWVQGPVEHRRSHRRAHFLSIMARNSVEVVVQRLRCAVEHQADAHAGREHHRNPRGRRKFRLFIDVAQADGAELGGGDEDNKYNENRAEEDVGPTKVVNNEAQCIASEVRKVGRSSQAPCNDGGNEHASDADDGPVDWSVVIGCHFNFRLGHLMGSEVLIAEHVL